MCSLLPDCEDMLASCEIAPQNNLKSYRQAVDHPPIISLNHRAHTYTSNDVFYNYSCPCMHACLSTWCLSSSSYNSLYLDGASICQCESRMAYFSDALRSSVYLQTCNLAQSDVQRFIVLLIYINNCYVCNGIFFKMHKECGIRGTTPAVTKGKSAPYIDRERYIYRNYDKILMLEAITV